MALSAIVAMAQILDRLRLQCVFLLGSGCDFPVPPFGCFGGVGRFIQLTPLLLIINFSIFKTLCLCNTTKVAVGNGGQLILLVHYTQCVHVSNVCT